MIDSKVTREPRTRIVPPPSMRKGTLYDASKFTDAVILHFGFPIYKYGFAGSHHHPSIDGQDLAGDVSRAGAGQENGGVGHVLGLAEGIQDRKSTRLNSSHSQISYAVFCLK